MATPNADMAKDQALRGLCDGGMTIVIAII